MSKFAFIGTCLIAICLLFFEELAGQARDQWEMSCLIRHDKFDYVLPKAMRNNNIDMWIIIDKGRGTEPLFRDFGEATSNGNGIIVFTDRGGDRIERAVFGGEPDMVQACGVYDIFMEPEDLRYFVAKRNPKRIGVNFTTATELLPPEGRHLGDGLSYTDYNNLRKTLGEPFASRLVSAEKLISDFRSERVASEIIEFSKIADITRKLEERALSNEVITPGKTTMIDVVWWLEEKRQRLGLESGWHPTVFLSPSNGIEISNTDRVIQPGDVIQIDWGIVFTSADEWGGNKVPVNIEENALITDRGIEWVHPPQNRVLVIR